MTERRYSSQVRSDRKYLSTRKVDYEKIINYWVKSSEICAKSDNPFTREAPNFTKKKKFVDIG